MNLEAALGYARRGWRVFPLHGIVSSRCTCGRTDCSSPGKHPLVRRGLYEATSDGSQIQQWWRQWRCANVGIVTGAESGIVVVDVDLPAAMPSLTPLLELGFAPTLTGLTGGGGIHLVYASEDPELGNSAGHLPGIDEELPGIDLRGNGGYVVDPPSLHRSGGSYQWLDVNCQIVPAPLWLKQPTRTQVDLDGVARAELDGDGSRYGLTVLREEMNRLRGARMGTRNHQLNRSAFALARFVAGGELLGSAARCSALTTALAIGLSEAESRQTIDSAFGAGLRQPRVAPHRLRRQSSRPGLDPGSQRLA